MYVHLLYLYINGTGQRKIEVVIVRKTRIRIIRRKSCFRFVAFAVAIDETEGGKKKKRRRCVGLSVSFSV